MSGAVAIVVLAGTTALANRDSQALVAEAAFDIYSLDRDRAIDAYRQAVAADPDDAAAYRGLASALWLSITFRRGNVTVDDYIGKLTRPDLKLPPPPADVAAAFRDAVDRALALGHQHIAARPNDAEAHFQLGSAIGLRASYIVTVDGSILGGVRVARGAYEEHEKVLELDPSRADAGLIVGTYRYLVSALALPMRWAAYMAGFGGGKEKGLRLIRAASDYPGENQTDARLALLLIYNREGRFDDALAELAALRERYPRNRIFWLETGATNLRAGRPAEAERFLNEGIRRLSADDRPRMFGEPALWYYKRGAARAALDHVTEAGADLNTALASEGRPWVYGRTHLEIGKLALKAGDRAGASAEFRQAIALCESDNDAIAADQARRLLP